MEVVGILGVTDKYVYVYNYCIMYIHWLVGLLSGQILSWVYIL